MKSFVYTYDEKVRGGHCHKTVHVYWLSRGTPILVSSLTETYVSEFQLVMMALEKSGALPSKAFERHPFGSYKYGQAYLLREAKIANVNKV